MKNDRDLDEIYADTWDRRDQNLGGMTYDEYLASEHWSRVKQKAAHRPNYKKCEFCPCTVVELHHTSYKWILTPRELLTVISLCREHHAEVHALARSANLSVRNATNTLRRKYKPNFWEKNRLPK